MRLGLSLTSHHPGVPPDEAVATTIARTSAAAAAGLDHLTLGDKHSVGADNVYLQGVPMLARCLGAWPAERPAGLLFLLPLWHPVLAAEMIGTLAAMTNTRFIVQTGIGGGRSQFSAMGASLTTRGAATDEAIDVVDRLLRGEMVTSERFGIDGAAIGPRPDQPVEWWIGSGSAPAALDRAARVGDALYLSPGWSLDDVARLSADYRGRCEALGRASRVILRRDVFVTDDDAVGVATGDRLAADGYRGMSREVLLCGGVGRVIDGLAPFVALGIDDIVARTMAVPAAEAIRSVELLGPIREAIADLGS